MQRFKERWEIQKNWQLIFPLLGILGLLYSSYKISISLFKNFGLFIDLIITLILAFVLLKFTLFLFKKLEKKWVLTYRWEMIRVFLIFALTGTSSLFIGKPIIKFLGITKDNLSPGIYWTLYIFIGLIFYQILLVSLAWLFGQFQFFWQFEKKMLGKFGLGQFFKE